MFWTDIAWLWQQLKLTNKGEMTTNEPGFPILCDHQRSDQKHILGQANGWAGISSQRGHDDKYNPNLLWSWTYTPALT